jgi:hypothetical protein
MLLHYPAQLTRLQHFALRNDKQAKVIQSSVDAFLREKMYTNLHLHWCPNCFGQFLCLNVFGQKERVELLAIVYMIKKKIKSHCYKMIEYVTSACFSSTFE